MTVIAGMEDLKPAKVLGWNLSTGRLIAMTKDKDDNTDIKEYEIYVSPNGHLKAKEYVPDTSTDQTPLTEEEREERLARRWAGTDQT